MTNAQSILQQARQVSGQEAVDRYIAESEGSEPDFLAMKKSILIDGKTAYASANDLYGSGESNRSLDTLRHHVKAIVADIYEVLIKSIDQHVQELADTGHTSILNDLAPSLRMALDELGMPTVEDTRFRVVED